ncbi:MAG: hypothetical protein LBT30_02575 [Clostridiales bacterium]|jgi:hypothetical protein|nr:hypothetical protein [Clostridiales bacterium]MDR3263171.1 hypothetical protein [Clostridiales bacterium]
MAKKNKKQVEVAPVVEAPKGPFIVYRTLPNPAPVAISAPTPIMQINPIVQPIALVPYGTQNQPVLQVEE